MSADGNDRLDSENGRTQRSHTPRAAGRPLIILAVCGGAMILWAGSRLWKNVDPGDGETQAILKRAIGVLHSEKSEDRLAAINEMERFSEADCTPAIPPLLSAFGDPVVSVRVATVRALGSIGSSMLATGADTATIRNLTRGLIQGLSDPDPEVRHTAVTCLGRMNSITTPLLASFTIDRKSGLDALVECLGDRVPVVRLAAIKAMAMNQRSAEPPTALAVGLTDESAKIRSATVISLMPFRQGLDSWVPKILQLAEHDPDPNVHEACLNFMANLHLKPPTVTRAVVPALIVSLRSAKPTLRYHGALFLDRLGPEARAAIPELLRLLNEPLAPELAQFQDVELTEDKDPGSIAARALGSIGPGSAEAGQVIKALTEVARSGPLIRRTRTVYALGRFGSAAVESVDTLIGIINDPTSVEYIRNEMANPQTPYKYKPDSAYVHGEAEAARALGNIAPGTPMADKAVTVLLTVLNSDASFSRTAAIEALCRFGPKATSAIPHIRTLTVDKEKVVSDAAVKALPLIGGEGEAASRSQ